ncbi:MAG TPA: AraC family transcriptional regulator [Puia sp.]|jgi:AraC-like DNA-binding protein|nr:AraC family transcriptional regulator [Puia sp.]
MKLQDPVPQETDPAPHWHMVQLPVGLKVATVKDPVTQLELALPEAGEKGLTLTFIHYKGELLVHPANRPDQEGQPASPGMGLLSMSSRPLLFRSKAPIQFIALSIFLPDPWLRLFLAGNDQFSTIEQLLEADDNVITSRLGRRQMSLLTSALAVTGGGRGDLLRMQNDTLGLLEYFLANRHRGLLGMSPVSDIENEDDLSLIREVESYISEYYCSDTFTVDSILKKTYTSYHRLNFLFKSIHGMTISEYIRNKRIEKSKEMIADNAKSISQIAYEIGYSSISNYILAFKKVYRITPGKYKKQMGA